MSTDDESLTRHQQSKFRRYTQTECWPSNDRVNDRDESHKDRETLIQIVLVKKTHTQTGFIILFFFLRLNLLLVAVGGCTLLVSFTIATSSHFYTNKGTRLSRNKNLIEIHQNESNDANLKTVKRCSEIFTRRQLPKVITFLIFKKSAFFFNFFVYFYSGC